jgi:hypothetical protein
MEWNDIQAVEEVLPESLVPDLFFNVPVGCCKDGGLAVSYLVCLQQKPFHFDILRDNGQFGIGPLPLLTADAPGGRIPTVASHITAGDSCFARS